MKTRLHSLLVGLASIIGVHQAAAQGTAFTYQGRLNNNGNPASGIYDFRFKLYSDSLGNAQVGASDLVNAVPVTNGLFTTRVDFGAGIFTGSNYWLEVDVETNNLGSYTVLTPLQAVTPAPYAVFAGTAGNLSGTVASANFAGTYGNAVTLNNAGNSLSGTFAGNGAAVTNVNAATLNGQGAANFWQLGGNNVAGGQFLGSTNNQPLEFRVGGMRVGLISVINGFPNITLGSPQNIISNATVASSILGGSNNSIQAVCDYSVIGGGHDNVIWTNAMFSVIGGGRLNTVGEWAFGSVVGGGDSNTITGTAYDSFIGGGWDNFMQPYVDHSFIGSGFINTIMTNSYCSVLSGGRQNIIGTNSYYTFMGGGNSNTIQANCFGAFLGGGEENGIQDNSDHTFLGGGSNNLIGGNAPFAAIVGGNGNAISNNTLNCVVGGGFQNSIQGGANNSVLGGGSGNSIQQNATYSFIGGGYQNSIQPYDYYSVLGGGYQNSIQTEADHSVLGGGDGNTIGPIAFVSFLGGGYGNNIQAEAGYSVLSGGYGNTIGTNAIYAMIPGGYKNAVGNGATYAFAAGNQAQANHTGSFVWADSQNAVFATTASNQFLIRAQGGVGIGATNLAVGGALTIRSPAGVPPNSMLSADNALVLGQYGPSSYKWIQSYGGSLTLNPLGNNVGIGTTNPVHLFQVLNAYCDGNQWYPSSDRNLKSGFESISPRAMLDKVAALPITRWHYTNDAATAHLGPMAQDFYAAFQVGPDDRHISTLDEGSVALAAIQGLNQKLEEQNQAKDAEIEGLKRSLAELKSMVQQLAEKP